MLATGDGWKDIFSAIPIASCACAAASFMVNEVKDPEKTIPASPLIGLILVIALYLAAPARIPCL